MVVTSCTCTNNTASTTDSTGNVPNPLPAETLDQLFIWNSYYASDNNNDINVYQRRDETNPLTDLQSACSFQLANTRQHLWILVQPGPFAMEDNLHGACIYTATAFGKGSVICGNRFAIECYDLAAGNTSQTKRSFVIELGRLLIICSTSI